MATRSGNSSSSYKKYEIRKRNPDPKTSVLLVIDVQNYFSSMAKPILPAINTTIDLCRRSSIPVMFTRHCHKSPADYGMLGEWWNNDLIFDGTPEAELMPDLAREPLDEVVEKSTYSAFMGTRLEERLRELGIEEVIVTGVMTNLCCETTAREAFVRGFRVFFSSDATATAEAELHEATLKNMAYGFAYLVDCQRIRDAFPVKVAYLLYSDSSIHICIHGGRKRKRLLHWRPAITSEECKAQVCESAQGISASCVWFQVLSDFGGN